MSYIKTHGILLKQTLLANDDAFLEFFTLEFGKIVVSVKKFSRSIKKKREIDFFRLLEFEIFQGRNTKSLKNIQTISIYNVFSKDIDLNTIGFEWISRLHKILPEEKPFSNLFQIIIQLWTHVQEADLIKIDAFFRIKILTYSGTFPRFDQIRNAGFFSPENFIFQDKPFPSSHPLSNEVRQVIEFLRRSNTEEFLQKADKLPKNNFQEIENILNEIENFHQ